MTTAPVAINLSMAINALTPYSRHAKSMQSLGQYRVAAYEENPFWMEGLNTGLNNEAERLSTEPTVHGFGYQAQTS